MPRTRKDEAPLLVDAPVIQGRYVDLDGYTVSFETFPADADATEAFRGLPDDRCQCPHWGLVLAGRLVLRYRDHIETYRAGDAYYAPPGHVPVVSAGTETVEFSPADALRRTTEVVAANTAMAEGGPR
ncbi:hypothetical protein [Kitasatospora sp. NPDC001547]|uniref:hypothetical protein n=1 Tax=Kitasatospora sp. NPDC001547 TaxID=3364015 RepID=UPI0036A4759B|nr:hypothetical protein KitaXyl93_69220 [Kitasatospora sp. Xyl93]